MVWIVRILLLVLLFKIAVRKGAAKFVLKPLPETNSWHDFLQQTVNVSTLEEPGRVLSLQPLLTPVPTTINWLLMTSGNDETTEPCRWTDNVVCSNQYRPICVTNFRCIYIVQNKCLLDQINCGCQSHYILPPKICKYFVNPYYKRCNLKIFIQ